MSLLTRLRSMLSATPQAPATPAEPAADVALTDDGFVLGERAIAWADVTRIRTYKLDFDTIDCVCLCFEPGAGDPVEVTEESNGFNDFMDEMLERFPTIDRDWYAHVMTPAFERNEAILFDRNAG